jgi:TetR/AcrR family transcriptional repressor of nem operon
MKVSREEAAANRAKIVDAAGRLFRDKGFDGIGVADIMKSAGLTHGGFYGHFKSKAHLEAEACDLVYARAAERWAKLVDEAKGDAFAVLIDRYLSEDRLRSAEQGCCFALLGSDAARQEPSVRRSFTAGFESLVGILAKAIPGRAKKQRRERAISTFAQMIGALVLARSVDDAELGKEILSAVRTDIDARRRSYLT